MDFQKKTVKTITISLTVDDTECAVLDSVVWTLKDLFESNSRTVNDDNGEPTFKEIDVVKRDGNIRKIRMNMAEWDMLCKLYTVI